MMPIKPFFFMAVLMAALMLAGCAATGPGQLSPSEEDLARFERMPPVDAVSEVEQSLRGLEQKRLDFYAPEHYQVASQALAEAKAQLGAGSREQVIRKVATAEAVLRNGDRVMGRIKELIGPELQIKQRLETLGADQVYGPEYETVLKRLKEIIRDIETGKQEQAEAKRPELLQDMRDLQTRSLRYTALNETEELLKRVKNRGAEKLAPVSYAEALQAFELADKTIQEGVTDPRQIQQLADAALFAARRALYVTQAVAALTQMVTISPEQVILDEEYRLYRIARMLGAEDMRDHSLEAQSEQLAAVAAGLYQEVQQQLEVANILREAIINQASSELSRLTETVQRLRQEREAWQAEQALLQARLTELEASLAQSQARLASVEAEKGQLAQRLAQQQAQSGVAAAPGLAEAGEASQLAEPPQAARAAVVPAAQSVPAARAKVPLVAAEAVANGLEGPVGMAPADSGEPVRESAAAPEPVRQAAVTGEPPPAGLDALEEESRGSDITAVAGGGDEDDWFDDDEGGMALEAFVDASVE